MGDIEVFEQATDELIEAADPICESDDGKQEESDDSPGKVIGDLIQGTYGDYVAGEVKDVYVDREDKEVKIDVSIPGHGDTRTWGWDLGPMDDETNFVRILRDHGIEPDEPQKLVGQHVLVRPKNDVDGSWKMYKPGDADKHIPQDWYDRHPFSPYSAEEQQKLPVSFNTETKLLLGVSIAVGISALLAALSPLAVAASIALGILCGLLWLA